MQNGNNEYTETINNPPYEGTIIDVETNYDQNPICFGSLHDNKLSILYVTDNDPDTWHQHAQTIEAKLKELPRPYLAFRVTFDQEIISSFIGRPIPFDGDLNTLHQSKDKTARKLGAPIIPDPLKGQSKDVPKLWGKYLRTKQQYLIDRIIKHNRACLLKENHISQQAGWKPISEYTLTTKERTTTIKPQDETTQQLLQALIERRILGVAYLDSKGNETNREVAVLSLGHQYFTGYCYLRNEIRTFKITRLSNISLTQKQIDESHLFWQHSKE